jgi:tRNA nucleotidyltransferase/poly(A) polymerase
MKQSATQTLKRLREAGFSAYFVGGCVRDQVMGIEPKDYDIATSATPDQVMQLFPRTVSVGARFGVVLVVVGNRQVEVATFRSDGAYADGRHPAEVTFTLDPRLDVLRRDFTMNGLLYDPLNQALLDYVGGQKDIEVGLVRTIGNPGERFREDKLRMMRAVRFAARFGFQLETETRAAIVSLADQIWQVSRERIRDELTKILTEGYASEGVSLLEECGLLRQLLPQVSDLRGVEQPPEFHPEGDVWVHTLLMLKLMDETRRDIVKNEGAPDQKLQSGSVMNEALRKDYPTLTLALGVLLHDVGKPLTFERKDRIRFNSHCEVGARLTARICERFRFTTRQTERAVQLVQDHLKFKDLPRMRESTVKRFLRQEGFEEHLELHRLDCLGSHRDLELWRFAKDRLQQLSPEEIRPPALISGDDLIELGFRPGPAFKEMLKAVEDAQLDNTLRSREEALKWVEATFKK